MSRSPTFLVPDSLLCPARLAYTFASALTLPKPLPSILDTTVDSTYATALESTHATALASTLATALNSIHATALASTHAIALASTHATALDSTHATALASTLTTSISSITLTLPRLYPPSPLPLPPFKEVAFESTTKLHRSDIER